MALKVLYPCPDYRFFSNLKTSPSFNFQRDTSSMNSTVRSLQGNSHFETIFVVKILLIDSYLLLGQYHAQFQRTGCWIKPCFCRNQQPTQQLVPSIPSVGTGLPQPPAVPLAPAELRPQWLFLWSISVSKFFYSKAVSTSSQRENCNHIHY